MCMPKAPKAPPPVAPRQAAKAPEASVTASRTREDLMRRSTLSSMILTGPNGLGAAPTAGKATLGS